MEMEQLQQSLVQVHQTAPDAKIFVRGDREAIHGNVIRLLNVVRSAGFYKMAFEIKSEAAKGVPSPAF
jgi:biopolymer transport protein ExbD